MSALLALGLAVALAAQVGTRLRLRSLRARVADAVHEVRGPLTAAGLALEAASRRGAIAPERAAGVEAQLLRAHRAVEDLAAAHAGGAGPDRLKRLGAQELLGLVIAGWAPAAAAAGRELRVSGSSPALVRADPVRLAQAVGNLVANALEHGAGPVDVRLRESGDRVRIEVRDRGAGLNRPLPRPRDRRAPVGAVRGRGLGIAAAIAERHGGRLVAAPAAGGAELAIELPAVRRGAEAAR